MTDCAPVPHEDAQAVPESLLVRGAIRFWIAVILTGVAAGIAAVALTSLLFAVQHFLWPPANLTLLDAAAASAPWRHLVILLAAGILTGLGQLLLVRLTSGNGIEITTALWFQAGRLPALRTIGSAVLSIVTV